LRRSIINTEHLSSRVVSPKKQQLVVALPLVHFWGIRATDNSQRDRVPKKLAV